MRQISLPRLAGWLAFGGFSSLFAWSTFGPLAAARGEWLFGFFRLRDLAAALLAGWMTLVLALALRASRQALFRALAATMGLLVGGILAEAVWLIAVRRVWQSNLWLDNAWIEPSGNLADPELGYKRRSLIEWGGLYATDELGFANPRGIRRASVVFLGDSFTEAGEFGGIRREETFVARVQERTGRVAVNLGVGGYGPQQQAIVLRRYGLSYQPDWVVWQVYEGNDLDDAERYAAWKAGPDAQREPWIRRLANHSLFARLLSGTIRQPDRVPQRLSLPGGGEIDFLLLGAYRPRLVQQRAAGARHLAEALREVHALCRTHGIKLLVVSVPVTVRVLEPRLVFRSPDERESFLPAGRWDAGDDFEDFVRARCEEQGIRFIDSMPAFRDQARWDPRRLYIPNNHFGADGHRVFADLVVAALGAGDH